MHARSFALVSSLATALLFVGACGDDHTDSHNENEVITTVTLTFTPNGGGNAVTAAFDDPDGDGGAAPTIDTITLENGKRYALAVTLTNKLAQPAEDITAEVKNEGAEHQLFFTGTAVSGPASGTPDAPLRHAYADKDSAGAPVGLDNTIDVIKAGGGKLTVTLRHLPPVNDKAVKTATLADTVSSGGISALPGESDVSVTFEVTVP